MLLGRCVWPELREQRAGVVVVEDRQERVSLALPQLDISGSLNEGLLVRWSKKSAGTCCSQTAVALPTSTTSVVISGQVSLSGRTRGRRRARHDPRLAPSSGQTARREDGDGFCAADALRTGPNSHQGRSVIMALTWGFTSGAEGTRTPDPHTAGLRGDRPSTSAGVHTRRSEEVRPGFRTLADGAERTWIGPNCYQNCSTFSHVDGQPDATGRSYASGRRARIGMRPRIFSSAAR